jgi:hypothetical protein
MVICMIISLFGLYAVVKTPQQNDITGYTPYGARARDEYNRYQDFFAHNGLGITVYIYALAKDGGSMLRDKFLKESLNVLDDAMTNVTMFDVTKNKSSNFNEFCLSFCSINEPVRQFYNGFHIQDELQRKKKPLNGRLILDYPISSLFGRTVTLQQNFFGIELYNSSDAGINGNSTETERVLRAVKTNETEERTHITNMKMVKMIVFQLRAEHMEGWRDSDVKKFEMDVVRRVE